MHLKTYRFDTGVPGPKFLILGAVHGNEPSGYIAINRLIENIKNETLNLKKGSLILLPCCNPPAFAMGERQINRNLNRDMRRYNNPEHYEDYLSNALCTLLEECDHLLDVHSYKSDGPAFLSIEDPEHVPSDAFGRALGIKSAIYGFSKIYGEISEEQKIFARGTKEYALAHGAAAITLECGQNEDPESPNRGYQAILNALQYLEMTDIPDHPKPNDNLRYVKMTKVFYKEKPGKLSRDWKNLDVIKKGEALIKYNDGETIAAEEDGYVVLPDKRATVGEEWVYLGVEGEV